MSVVPPLGSPMPALAAGAASHTTAAERAASSAAAARAASAPKGKEVPPERQLSVSDELTAAETGGWTVTHAPAAMHAIQKAEAVSRFVELHAAVKPGLRFLSVVSDFLSQDGVLKTFDRLRYGFGALASLATGYEQYQISPMKTDTFRNIDAGVAGAVDFAFGVTLPIIALLDGILNFALPKIAPDIKVKSGGFISGNLASLVRGGVALLEGVCTGDYGAAKTFASKARSGECGVLFEGGVKMFDALAKMVRTQPNESWLTHPA